MLLIGEERNEREREREREEREREKPQGHFFISGMFMEEGKERTLQMINGLCTKKAEKKKREKGSKDPMQSESEYSPPFFRWFFCPPAITQH